MIERHKDGEHYFVLPGGHVDKDETPEGAVVREVAEETGLRVTIDKLLYTSADDKYGNDQRIYLCNYLGGEPELQPDSQEYKIQQSGEPQAWLPAWFTFDELQGKTIYPRGLLRYVQEDQALNYRHNPYKILERPV
jgi:ADP-ribose pyrophosphatase YjhB (NUDIX family)